MLRSIRNILRRRGLLRSAEGFPALLFSGFRANTGKHLTLRLFCRARCVPDVCTTYADILRAFARGAEKAAMMPCSVAGTEEAHDAILCAMSTM